MASGRSRKEEVVPVLPYLGGGNIVCCITRMAAIVSQWLRFVDKVHRRRRELIVGLDVSVDKNGEAATLHLCVGRRSLIFQLIEGDKIPSALRQFLNDPTHFFVGINVERKVELLERYKISVSRKFDVRRLTGMALVGKDGKMLVEIANNIYGGHLEHIALHNWEVPELTDMGTEYLVRPVGQAEDEEDASDFEPVELNGDDEEDEDDDHDDADAGGKGEISTKRKRSSKDDFDNDGSDDDDETVQEIG